MSSEEAEQLSRRPEVREALDQTRGKKVKAGATDKFWFVTHALGLVGCGVLYYLLAYNFVPLPRPHVELLVRLVAAPSWSFCCWQSPKLSPSMPLAG